MVKIKNDHRVKVLEVLEATVGGTRHHLVSLLRGLDCTRFEVEVACPEVRYGGVKDTQFVNEVQALNIPLHFIDMRREISPWVDFLGILRLYRLIRHQTYDIVHLHSSKAGFLGRIATKLNGIPTIYTPHGFYFLNASKSTSRDFFLLLEQIAGRLTDRLIAVSDSEGKIVIENKVIPDDRLEIIPNGIDVDSFRLDSNLREQMRNAFGITSDQVVIGIVSRYIPQKDPLTLVRAAEVILKECPNVRFVWCGEGELREETETLARQLGIHDAFAFLGFRTDVKEIMQAFDIFVLSSIFEGLPYTLLETMALGLPVVATDVVGSRDVVVHNSTGLLVSPRNPVELAGAVTKLIKDPELRIAMGYNAEKLIRERYDVKKMVMDIQNVYATLVSSS